MEESEKRKERLRAMRGVAGQDSPSSSTATRQLLLNPLAQPSTTPPAADRSPRPSRFDYYTDPMSAYAANRSRSGHAHRPPYTSSSPLRCSSPISQESHCTTPIPANHFQVGPSPHQGSYATPPPVPHHHGIWRSPLGMAGPVSPHSSVGMFGSPSPTGPPSNSSSSISARYSFVRSVSPSAEQQRVTFGASNPRRGSPNVSSGRGSGWQRGGYQSPCSGRGSSQRGRHSQGHVSARESPGLFFNRMMLCDPWARLEPVVGCILEPKIKQMTADSQESWLPDSIRTKRVKAEESAPVPQSQGSLAEYLAQAMEEAAKEEAA